MSRDPSVCEVKVEDNCYVIQLYETPAFDFLQMASDGRLPGSGGQRRESDDSSASGSDMSIGISSSRDVLGYDNDGVSPMQGMSDNRSMQQSLGKEETADSFKFQSPVDNGPEPSMEHFNSGPRKAVQLTHGSPTLSAERAMINVEGPNSNGERSSGLINGPEEEIDPAEPPCNELQIVPVQSTDNMNQENDDFDGSISLIAKEWVCPSPARPNFFKQRNRRRYRATFSIHHRINKGDSMNSLSDDDIIRRNSIIRKEVEETLEIAERAGLRFEERAPEIAAHLVGKRLKSKGRKL